MRVRSRYIYINRGYIIIVKKLNILTLLSSLPPPPPSLIAASSIMRNVIPRRSIRRRRRRGGGGTACRPGGIIDPRRGRLSSSSSFSTVTSVALHTPRRQQVPGNHRNRACWGRRCRLWTAPANTAISLLPGGCIAVSSGSSAP